MAARGIYDLTILHGPDANEWSQYLLTVFEENHQGVAFSIHTYELKEDEPITRQQQRTFQNSKCIFMLLSGDFEGCFQNAEVLNSLRTILRPSHKVVVLTFGVTDTEYFTQCFPDWPLWTQLSSEDDPNLYISAVQKIISDGGNQSSQRKYRRSPTQENSDSTKTAPRSRMGSGAWLPQDSGCESVTSDPDLQEDPSISHGNLLSIQPKRIRCGVKTEMYFIFKCKLDSHVRNEVSFRPKHGTQVRLPATWQNEYLLSVEAPNLPPGLVLISIYSGNLVICEAEITYINDMEEICHLLRSATNPVEFMCQAFKIIPYNTETLDKLLTESLKNNIPATGLHLFGIHQIEEEDLSANKRDEELPTLLHFSAKYGLKNLTALLLTCPGALQAYSVQNKDGFYPNTLAGQYGYSDLRKFMDDYVETADMLKSHIKEELMQGEDDDSLYQSMANLSADILMKCSLHPGSDEDIYETMVGMVPQYDEEDQYMDIMQLGESVTSTDTNTLTAQDSMLRRFLEKGSVYTTGDREAGVDKDDHYQPCPSSILYENVLENLTSPTSPMHRPPVPVPRPEVKEPAGHRVISQVFDNPVRKENLYMDSLSRFGASIRVRRDRQQSSVYDPFVGMKTPGQRELITLQEQVKLQIITVDEAVHQFKAWQLNQKRRNDSFKFQQENLEKLRNSIKRRREANKKKKRSDLSITKPIGRKTNTEPKPDYAIYQPTCGIAPHVGIRRDAWNTGSTSSTTSSSSSRSSTRSTLSSGREGDEEDNDIPERAIPMPSRRPPKLPTRGNSGGPGFPSYGPRPPPVPPRGHQ